jgi:hypothetical protein
LLASTPHRGFVNAVFLAQSVTKSASVDLSGWPQWAIVLVGTLVAVILIWIFMKVMKVALWILLFTVLVGGLLWTGRLLLN